MARGWTEREGLLQEIYSYIYLFHMPLFFLISGIFCIEAMRKSPINTFISRTESIAWPYMFWDFFVRTAMLPLISPLMNSPPLDIGWMARLIQSLTGELSWFLWTLYVMQILLIPFARIPMWSLFLISLAACLYLQDSNLGSFNFVVDHLPFLLFGATLQPFLTNEKISHSWTQILLSLVAFVMLGVALILGWTTFKLVWVLCGIVGSLASLCLVGYLGKAVGQRLLANLGMASLAIYVLHPYFQGAAGQILFHIFGVSAFWQLVVPTVIAVLGPFIVWRFAQGHGMSWLFRLRFPKIAVSNFGHKGRGDHGMPGG